MNRSISIVGGGTSGSFTACFLAKNFPDANITWYFPQDNNIIGVGEATIPDVLYFLNDIDIHLEDIIKHCDGTLKLGIKFTGWLGDDHYYYHQFGSDEEEAASIKLMCDLNKVPEDINEYEIAVHFDSRMLSTYLMNRSMKYKNINILRRTVNRDALSDDVVIDCTGFNRNILETAVHDEFNTVKEIPNNSALIYRSKNLASDTINPYTTAKAMKRGWMWTIPLQSTTSYGYVHDDKYDVIDEFMSEVNCSDMNSVKRINFPSGRYNIHAHVVDNQLHASVGLSSAFIEPLESTGIGLTVRNIHSLSNLLKGNISIEEHNTTINNDYDTMLPFILAHYKYNKRTNKYWSQLRQLKVTNFTPGTIFNKLNWSLILTGMNQHKLNLTAPNINKIKAIRHGSDYTDWVRAI